MLCKITWVFFRPGWFVIRSDSGQTGSYTAWERAETTYAIVGDKPDFESKLPSYPPRGRCCFRWGNYKRHIPSVYIYFFASFHHVSY